MKVGSVSRSRVLVALPVLVLVVVFCLLGTSNATGQYIAQVIPKVNVESGGILSITGGTTNGNMIDFGEVGPGTTQEKTLSFSVTANDSWRLTVSKAKDFECTNTEDPGYGSTIPSASFTFTSNGPAGPTYVTTSTEFAPVASPANVATGTSAISDSNVNVVYRLAVPSGQPRGYYAAPSHTYTLVVGSP